MEYEFDGHGVVRNRFERDRRYTAERTRKALLNQLAKLDAEEERQEAWGEDVYSDGDVLCARIRFGTTDQIYEYVLMKVGRRWYTTAQNKRYDTWEGIVSDFADAELVGLYRVTRWEAV